MTQFFFLCNKKGNNFVLLSVAKRSKIIIKEIKIIDRTSIFGLLGPDKGKNLSSNVLIGWVKVIFFNYILLYPKISLK